MSDDSPAAGCLGIVAGVAIGLGLLVCVVYVFATFGIAAGLLFLLFGVPIAATVLYWIMMVVFAPILIAMGLMSRKQ
jgi:hypothetical protein